LTNFFASITILTKMKTVNRREFLGSALVTGSALTSAALLPELVVAQQPMQLPEAPVTSSVSPEVGSHQTPVDFRYAPALRQTAFCFPDDHYKSLIHQNGDLAYGFDMEKDVSFFPLKFRFSMYGMQKATAIDQTLESPSIPIVLTTLEQGNATMKLTTFATNRPGEGRVDNVFMEILPKQNEAVSVSPLVQIRTIQKCELKTEGAHLIVSQINTGKVLFVGMVFQNPSEGTVRGTDFDVDTDQMQQLTLHRGIAAAGAPYRAFFRFPQEGQSHNLLIQGLDTPEQCLQEARNFWKSWSAFHDPVSWTIPDREGEFLAACARNILQAREVKNGKLTFQVGPTCYRGLWVVDGNFILEAARYLGYDKEAIEGLLTTWSKQLPSGQIVAEGGLEHYKDTAIAMFTLVRQCELSQDWSLLRQLEPNVASAIQFLDSLRARARQEGSALGKYGLLAKGFADGGFDGTRNEFTNTLWTMAGLKAIGEAGEQQKLPRVASATRLYRELYAAFNPAAAQEMRSYEGNFQYLPMLLKDDPAWSLPDPWDRPRPQCAQWALSHTIFPGLVFDSDHPVLQGHIKLMQAVKREGIPAETGWNGHEAVWAYNALFVAQVYLWLGMKQAARDTFIGFLNHASPQYCWREEQPLQEALVGTYIGEMPHNWASAECIRFLRHCFALEDGQNLRLLAGLTQAELDTGKPYVLQATPTRFGRLDLNFEPLDRRNGWRLSFRRSSGPDPVAVSVPSMLGNLSISQIEGVKVQRAGDIIKIEPSAREWTLTWKT
jgi:hypothetical protein